MKKFICLVVCLLILTGLGGCADSSYDSVAYVSGEDLRFEIKEDGHFTNFAYYNVLKDKETGVCYLYVKCYNGAGLTVILNEDGTPYTANK